MDKEPISPKTDLLASVLWQYDKAPNLVGMMESLQEVMDLDSAGFWAWFQENVFDLDNANPFGVSLWAVLAGVELPQKPADVADDVWLIAMRKFVKASIAAKWSSGTAEDLCRYLKTIFGDWDFIVHDGGLDGEPMSVSFIAPYAKIAAASLDTATSEEKAKKVLAEYDALFIHPAAVKSYVQRFDVDGIIALAEVAAEGETEPDHSGDSALDNGIVFGEENAVRFGWNRNVFGMNEDDEDGQFAMNLSAGTAILDEGELEES